MTQLKLNQELFDAINAEQLKQAESLLNQGASISAQDELGRSPLMRAVQQNSLPLVRLCLTFEADPNQRDITRLTPFICAAANGFSELVAEMIKSGADLASVNRFGGTALLPSSEKGFLKTVQLCLQAGVPVNHQNRLGWSALLEAVILGDGGYLYQDIVRELVGSGAEINQVDFDNKSALDYGRELEQETIQHILAQTEKLSPLQEELRELIKHEQWHEFKVMMTNQAAELSVTENYYLTGYALQEQQEFALAEKVYLAGSELSAEFYFYLANLYRVEKRIEAALDAFSKGAKAGKWEFFRYHESNYLRELGRHEAALGIMQELLDNAPERTDYYFHQANSFRSLGRHDEALAAMDHALTFAPDHQLFKEHREQSRQLLK